METISTTKRVRSTYSEFVVEASVTFTPDQTGAISDGQIHNADGIYLGYFSVDGQNSLNMSSNGSADHAEVFDAVQQFIADAKKL